MSAVPLREPEIAVLGVSAVPHAAAPTLTFALEISDDSGLEIYTIALTAQLHVEARERAHDDETRQRLADVFGGAERWGDTARGVLWATREVLVPSFTGTCAFELQVPCSADLELATTRYLQAVPDGLVPLAIHFSGSVLYRGADDRLQVTQVPWHATARYALPLAAWRAAVGDRGGLVRVSDGTFDALRRYRLDRGLHSLDDAVAELLDAARAEV
jgi:hypothetical protein